MFGLWWQISGVLILCGLSFCDIKTHKIPVCGMAAVFIFSAVNILCFDTAHFSWTGLCLSLIPGGVLIMLSLITEGKIGVGDGILVTALGLGLGLERCMLVLTGALILNSVFCGVLLALKKAGRNTRIPFVPFITIGMGVIVFAYG